VTLVDFSPFPACLAFPEDMLVLDIQFSLGILAFSTKYEFVDEHIEEILQFFLVVRSVDDMTLSRSIADDFCLSTEFETEELGNIHGRTSEIMSDVHDIRDNCLDAVSFSFDLEVSNIEKRMSTLDCTGCILYR